MKIILSLIYAPMIFFILRYFNTSLEDVIYLKAFPLIMALVVTITMIISYINKNSLILYFANKFSKDRIEDNEKEYIHNWTIFWIFISSINVMIHSTIFLTTQNTTFWVFYSSVGWYFLFIIAGLIQFMHRKFVFLKGRKIET